MLKFASRLFSASPALKQPLVPVAHCPMVAEPPIALTRDPASPQGEQAQEVVRFLCRTIVELNKRVQQMEQQQGVAATQAAPSCPARDSGLCPLVDPNTGYYTGPVHNLLP